MKRDKFLLLVFLLAFQVSVAVFGQTPGVKVTTSANWVAGSWSLVELAVNAGSGAGPCRFVQDFPVGFSVRAVDVGDGDLFFDNSRLNIVWSKLPVGGRTTISFEVMPERSLSGLVELGGVLYAVTGAGNRTIVSVPPKNIIISAGVATANEREQVTRVANTMPEGSKVKGGSGNKSVEPLSGQAGGIQFRVQVLSSSSRISDSELKRRLGISFQERVTVVAAVSIYKYQVGECPDFDCATLLLERFKKAGVSGAFVVAFRDGQQITIDEARAQRR